MEVRLKYNPYTRKKDFVIGSKTIVGDELSNFFGGDNTEILNLTIDFLEALYNYCNDDIDFKFIGIQRDYDFLETLINEYLQNNPDININLIGEKIIKVEDRLNQLKNLFTEMQNTTPFPQLKTPDLKDLFEKMINSDFEIAVVATMSSGKSTLINSMIGKELLPARNEATTAILARIHDNDNAQNFSAESFDVDGKKVQEINPLTLQGMEALNSDKSTSIIEIEGNIPNINSSAIKLVLTDTPGPNNSRTDKHEKQTYRLIKADYKPMILYIFNATQLETNDDKNLLKDIAEAMKVKGKQSSDRFLFVLNKADELDPEKGESVEKKIQDLKKYLEQFEIYNPRIFPTSSYLAKVIRMEQNGEELTKKEKLTLNVNVDMFIETKELHFSDYANFLSTETKRLLEQKIQEVQNNGNQLQEALYYSGIPSIELAITEYLNKYAIPEKISKGVNTFKDKLESLRLEAKETEKLKNNEQEVKHLQESIQQIEKVINEGEKGKALKDKIQKISTAEEINQKLEKCSSSFMSRCNFNNMRKSKVTPDIAQEYVHQINITIKSAQMRLEEDIKKVLEDVLINKASQYINEYQKYVKSLVGDVKYNNISSKSILGDVGSITIEETLEDYRKTEHIKEKTGTRQVKNNDYHFGDGFWNIFRKEKKQKYFEEDVFRTRTEEYIDFCEFIDNEIFPEVKDFSRIIRKLAGESANSEIAKFKNFFINQINKLEAAIQNKFNYKKAQLQDKTKFENMIKENETHLKWLKGFTTKLDELLFID